MRLNASKLVAPDTDRREIVRYRKGNVKDVMKVIMSVVRKRHLVYQVADYAKDLEADNEADLIRNLKILWRDVRSKIRYKRDPDGYQLIKHPYWLYKDKEGDCKSMTVFIYFVAYALGLDVTIRLVTYPFTDVRHVYPIVHLPSGRQIIVDAVSSKFNYEKRYISKIDEYVKSNLPSSIGSTANIAGVQKSKKGAALVFIAMIALALNKSNND